MNKIQFDEFLNKLAEGFSTLKNDMATKSNITPGSTSHEKSIAADAANVALVIGKYAFDQDDEMTTFERWFERKAERFQNLCTTDDERKAVLLEALGCSEYEQLLGRTSPMKPTELTFSQIVVHCTQAFASRVSDFRRRFDSLMKKVPSGLRGDVILNRACIEGDQFKRAELTDDLLKVYLALLWTRDNDDYNNFRTVVLKAVDDKPNLTVAELRNIVSRHESRSSDAKLKTNNPQVTDTNKDAVFVVQSDRKKYPKSNQNFKSSNQAGKSITCNRCAAPGHKADACRFKDYTCHNCDRKGHLAKACRSKTENLNNVRICDVASSEFERARTYVIIQIEGKSIKFQCDSGADITTVGTDIWKQLGMPKLKQMPRSCRGVGNSTINMRGYFNATLRFNDKSISAPILVIVNPDYALLGNVALRDLGIVSWNIGHPRDIDVCSLKLDDVQEKFPRLFADGIGACNKKLVNLRLSADVHPVHLRHRSVALAVQDALERELDRLVANDTLERVETSDWASPIVVVRKANGNIRLCADFSTGLNAALTPDVYPIPNMEEMLSRFTGNRVFSKIDLSSAYHQLMLDDVSKPLTTISTHKGLFQFKRLPFGIKTAASIFQRTMDDMLAGIANCYAYQDDIIIMGPDKESHDGTLHQVLSRLEDWGFKVHPDKCEFYVPEINYLGRIVNAKGITVNPSHIQAILDLKRPANQSEVRSLLGLVNYYGKFVKKLYEFKRPLEFLLKRNSKFIWSKEQEAVFIKIKELLSSPLLLDHYDPSRQLIVAADASNVGIGGVLLQRYPDGNEKAVFHMNKALDETQRGYSQIEKESLALLTTVERFHKFLWGRRFTLQTDHRPLVALFNPSSMVGLTERAAARLKRWALRLIGYDFEIEYISTDKFGHADALSRLIRQAKGDAADYQMDEVIASIKLVDNELSDNVGQSLPDVRVREQLRTETAKDRILKKLIDRINRGWDKNEKDDELKVYAQRSDSFCIVNGIILKDDRVVIPNSMRSKVLNQLHVAHPGMRRMVSLARHHFYWPNLVKDVEDFVKKCGHCAIKADQPVKVPLSPWPESERPWTRIHADFGEVRKGKAFILVVDSHSKYVDAEWISPATTSNTVKYFRKLFRHFGVPGTIVTDNGTQFTSIDFATLMSEMNVTHLRCAPRHPQSNGMAEKMIHTIKAAIDTEKQDLDCVVSAYNYTPNATLKDKTPAEVFFGRPLRTPLDAYHPEGKVDRSDNVRRMTEQFDRHHGTRARTFNVNDKVVVQLWNGSRVQGSVTKIVGKCTAIVAVGQQRIKRHFNQLWNRQIAPAVSEEEIDPDLPSNPIASDISSSPVSTDTATMTSVTESTPRSPSSRLTSPRPKRANRRDINYRQAAGLRVNRRRGTSLG